LPGPVVTGAFLGTLTDDPAKLDRFAGRIPGLFANTLRLDRLDRIRDLHANWGEQSPVDADGYLELWETLGRLLDGETA